MTQEEKQLLLKDLCARLPYNVVINCEGRGIDYKCFLTTDILNEILLNQEYYDYKPYLRQMSSITEEEKEEIKPLFSKFIDGLGKTILVVRQNKMVLYQDWLNSHYFDYRRLIKKGLALEAPKEMYKTE